MYPNLGKFASANEATSHTVDELNYSFVLTDSSGMREYGHCSGSVNGEVLVVLSSYPWCNFFYRLMYLFRSNGDEGRNIVKLLMNAKTPPSGASFVIPSLDITFRRPYDRLCSFIDSSPIRMLTVFPNTDDLFSVLAALLLEKHIIVVGPNFSLVSNVIMSLQALISPFDWMHILIPIVPSSLIDVLAAPPPYLVGILTSQLPLLKAVPIESCIVVHIGNDAVCTNVQYVNEEADVLPHSGLFSAVRIGLNILKLRHPMDQTVSDLCSLFMTYYASLIGEVVLQGSVAYVKKSESQSRTTLRFFERLLTTQSFSILREEVSKSLQSAEYEWLDNEFIVAAIRSHPEIFPSQYNYLIEEEKKGGGYVATHGDCFGSKETFNSVTAAIHGFGGHKLGVGRLFARCLCRRWFDNEFDEVDQATFYPGKDEWISNSHRKRAESPTVLNE
ncbi:hypothetical protein AGDE_00828 [Angomonas deanei]|nr:hypothetical protein AGDE_00828 [Angomonas deanei]|eukprot:EPY43095.1 hypothetical protein AGDE_00828 [Angomonas deanei]